MLDLVRAVQWFYLILRLCEGDSLLRLAFLLNNFYIHHKIGPTLMISHVICSAIRNSLTQVYEPIIKILPRVTGESRRQSERDGTWDGTIGIVTLGTSIYPRSLKLKPKVKCDNVPDSRQGHFSTQ